MENIKRLKYEIRNDLWRCDRLAEYFVAMKFFNLRRFIESLDKNSAEYSNEKLSYIFNYERFIEEVSKSAFLYPNPSNINKDTNKDLGLFYMKEAKNEASLAFSNSFTYWLLAYNSFLKSLNLNKQDAEAVIGCARCLLKYGKFNDALKLLNDFTQNPNFKNRIDYCLIKAKAHEYRLEFHEAKELLLNAKHIDNSNNLKIQEKIKSIEIKCKTKLEHEQYCFNFNNIRKESERKYKILSIDGGGIRGIIPAFWLSEIEKRTHRPISHLFNMIAGASTSAVISAGLSIRKTNDHIPMYRASDLVNFYKNEAYRIFSPHSGSASRYSDHGRYNLFTEYFGNRRLSESLPELIIPAWRMDSGKYVFSRHYSCVDASKNYSYVDTLMAASASPGHFQPFKIGGEKGTTFADGAAWANNPSMLAFNEAKRYYAKERDIFVLSLGTGWWHMSDKFKKHVQNVNQAYEIELCDQMNYIDSTMIESQGLFGYKRFQAYMDTIHVNEIDICTNKHIDILLEYANEQIEDLDNSDDNSLNKLVEFLLY